jgi:hypothetical protein
MWEAFGLAWRLLDDLRDYSADMAAGERSGIYYLLSDQGRDAWLAASKTQISAADAVSQELEDVVIEVALRLITCWLIEAEQAAL